MTFLCEIITPFCLLRISKYSRFGSEISIQANPMYHLNSKDMQFSWQRHLPATETSPMWGASLHLEQADPQS